MAMDENSAKNLTQDNVGAVQHDTDVDNQIVDYFNGGQSGQHEVRSRQHSIISINSSVTSKRSSRSIFSKVKSLFVEKPGKTEKLKNRSLQATSEIERQRATISRLVQENSVLRKNGEIIDSTRKLLSVYLDKLHAVVENAGTHLVIPGSVRNLQIGDHNQILTDEVNELLLGFYETLNNTKDDLEHTGKRCKHILEELSDTKDALRKVREENEYMNNTLEEMLGELRVIKTQFHQDRDKLLQLDYIIRLPSARIIDDCVDAIRQLPHDDRAYTYEEVPEAFKLGIMRILRKYERDSMTTERFCRRLGVTMDKHTSSGELLTRDNCADILVKWVHISPDNDARTLCETFPNLKKYGRVSGTLGSTPMEGSFSIASFTDNKTELSSLKDAITSMSNQVMTMKTFIKQQMEFITLRIQTLKNKQSISLNSDVSSVRTNAKTVLSRRKSYP